ncbi:HipA family kinase [Terriglobus albidus]|uniref:HipA family kinase n=1 Tax=Terriglobus albidus TaxID=1592106 RepID=UPI0021DFEC3F|nr:HipA family kinase [Terriglobus albidus]
MPLREVLATRYAVPLREGGSLPAIVEADDDGMYVVKFRGAGQGVKALLAEIVAGEIARTVGLRVPELVFVEIDAALGRNYPDEEIRDLLKASTGRNLGMDYLPGSTMFEVAAGDCATAEVASMAVWLDAFVMNVDRTPRNPNLLCWGGNLWFIDHGAALYVQHDWASMMEKAASPFSAIRDHVLLPWATDVKAAGKIARTRLSRGEFERILALVPDAWLEPEEGADTPDAKRALYVEFLMKRLDDADRFEEEATRARLV